MTLLDQPTPQTARTFSPKAIRHELLLTALSPISHHDASVQDDSNRNLFNRQVVIAQDVVTDAPTISGTQAQVIGVDHPVPEPLADMLGQLRFPEFLAALILRQFADEYNGMDGNGLFSGMDRWGMLGNRVPHAAYAATLGDFWARLLTMMQVGVPAARRDHLLLPLLSVPQGTQLDALHVLRTKGNMLTMLARYWHDAQKQMSEEYTEKKGKKDEGLGLFITPETRNWVTLIWEGEQLVTGAGRTRRLEVPHITANSLRHQMLREPAMKHLFRSLGIEPETLEPGVEAIFYNGGNIKAGATQPSNPSLLAKQIRAAYPSLDLLGGVANSFDLGESPISVHSILVCAETRHLLPEWAQALPAAQLSAFDMLEDFTLTRHHSRTDDDQMIFGFEGVSAGAQFLVTLDLKSYTPQLARGALMAALEEWQQLPIIGGAGARGFGQVRIEEWQRPDPEGDALALAAYNEYLEGHADGLREQLQSGKLGTGAVVVN